MKLSESIRHFRTMRNLTQEQLAHIRLIVRDLVLSNQK